MHATFYKNILITCLRKRDAVNRITTNIGGTAAIGVRMAASNFQLDYISDTVAEISFDFGLELQGRVLGLDSGVARIPGCSFDGIPRLSVCQELADMLSEELGRLSKKPFTLTSPTLLKRVERLMGASQGERIKLVIFRTPEREDDFSGFGRRLPSIPDDQLEPELGIDVPARLQRKRKLNRRR